MTAFRPVLSFFQLCYMVRSLHSARSHFPGPDFRVLLRTSRARPRARRNSTQLDWPGHVMSEVGGRWRRVERVGQLMGSSCSSRGGSGRMRRRRQAVRTRHSRTGTARQAVHGGRSAGRQTCQTNDKPHTRSLATAADFLLRRYLLGANRVRYARQRHSMSMYLVRLSA